jgi:hypothetical protein
VAEELIANGANEDIARAWIAKVEKETIREKGSQSKWGLK